MFGTERMAYCDPGGQLKENKRTGSFIELYCVNDSSDSNATSADALEEAKGHQEKNLA